MTSESNRLGDPLRAPAEGDRFGFLLSKKDLDRALGLNIAAACLG